MGGELRSSGAFYVVCRRRNGLQWPGASAVAKRLGAEEDLGCGLYGSFQRGSFGRYRKKWRRTAKGANPASTKARTDRTLLS